MTISRRLDTPQQNLQWQYLQHFPKDIRKVDAVNIDAPLLKNLSHRTACPKAARVFTPTVLIRRSKCTGISLAPIQAPIKKSEQD